MSAWIARLLTTRTGWVALALALATAGLTWEARGLAPSYDIEEFFPHHTAARKQFEQLRQRFGRDRREAAAQRKGG